MSDLRHGSSARHARIVSPLGEMLLFAEGQGIRGCYFRGQKHLPDAVRLGVEVSAADDALFAQAQDELAQYFAGALRTFSVPLGAVGDEFSLRCWRLLAEIPYGETTSYGELARKLGNRHLARRVGQVVGRNPISVIVPCHRVVGADGSLTGYAGGVERKRWLLEMESSGAASVARAW